MGRSKNRRELTRQIKHYLERELCPRLSIAPEFRELRWPELGTQSHLLLVYPESHPPFVIRWFDKRGEARHLEKLTRMAQSLELPIAPVTFTDTSMAHHRQYGFSVVVESLEEGRCLNEGELNPVDLKNLAGAAAQFHRHGDARWGPPDFKLPAFLYCRLHMMSKVRNRLNGVAQTDPDFRPEWRQEILGFFSRCSKIHSRTMPRFALVHGKLRPNNVLFGTQGRIRIIDLITMRYDDPGYELASAQYYFCRGPIQRELFLDHYFENLPDYREHYRQNEALFQAWMHLSRWTSRSRRRLKRVETEAPLVTRQDGYFDREQMWAWIRQGRPDLELEERFPKRKQNGAGEPAEI